ncbi:MAG: DNA-3-methyladenine glycosylase I [Ruminococcaceae bacterium]|nr:DNA-3-methyladenine glycosylase I [Oscillospiraceae bacterium]
MSYCNWSRGDALMEEYHDKEWGVPLWEDGKQFEFLMLEALQCGLSWMLMLKKREIFRECFDGFDYRKVAGYTEEDVERILNTPGMLRSVPKIKAVIGNAGCFEQIVEEYGSFCKYLWRYTDGKTVLYQGHEDGYIPVSNRLSEEIAKDLKKRGFKYLGSITVYSHLQACGMINDHGKNCPCYGKINNRFPTVSLPPDGERGTMHFE